MARVVSYNNVLLEHKGDMLYADKKPIARIGEADRPASYLVNKYLTSLPLSFGTQSQTGGNE